MVWSLLVLAYGIIKGIREVFKKKALERNSVIEVLFLYTFLSMLFVLPELPSAGGLSASQLIAIAFKSFAIFLAWIFSFRAIDRMPISLYGVIDLSRVLFATLLGILVLGESMGIGQILGFIFVVTGLLMLKLKKKNSKSDIEHIEPKYVFFAFASCILNAVSGLMDKILMTDMTDGQLQFWYMVFLVLYYILYIIFSRTKLNWLSVLKNYWVWLLALLFVIADRALFIANGYPESRITVMTLIKQSGCVVTILAGRIIFHEKNTGYKFFCAAIVIIGIILSTAL